MIRIIDRDALLVDMTATSMRLWGSRLPKHGCSKHLSKKCFA
ncbi:hypothetical protein NOVOSPHI9U_110017 [Novosphingobium sp. 9U]|nr:hypothetical protein NOVOSPHI9U_110017 [Novosphingobium sp. 9U]